MVNKELVVAHYNEDLEWINYIKDKFPDLKITIYSKSEKNENHENIQN